MSPSPNQLNVDVRALAGIVWNARWMIVGIVAVCTLLASAVLYFWPNTYRATALLMVNQQDSGVGGLQRLAGQFGGLASFAGLNLGGAETDRTAYGVEVMRSRAFLAEFIADRDILVPLLATDSWDAESQALIYDAELYDVDSGKWVREVSPPQSVVPSMMEAYEAYTDLLDIRVDAKTGFVTVSVAHRSPVVAAEWLTHLITDVNEFVMEKEVAEAQHAIEYLKQQVATTAVADLKEVFYRLIQEQMKTVMLAEVSSEYLFRVIDPPVPPEKHFKPRRVVALGATVILSFLFATALALLVGRDPSRPRNAGSS